MNCDGGDPGRGRFGKKDRVWLELCVEESHGRKGEEEAHWKSKYQCWIHCWIYKYKTGVKVLITDVNLVLLHM